MSGLHIAQICGRYIRRSAVPKWHWAVKLEGPAELVHKVACVKYELHDTYTNPVRTVNDAKTNFALEADSYGVFEIRATIVLYSGGMLKCSHTLKLFYPHHLEDLILD